MTSTLTLGTLAGEYAALDDLLAESEGELTEAIEALLNELDEKADTKIERVALYILGQQGRAKQVKEEEGRLAARRKAIEKGADSLKDYLDRTMREIGKEKVQGVLATVSLQKNPPSVLAPDWDEAALRGMAMYAPAFVSHTPESFALNRRAILDAHKNGQPLPEGVQIVQALSLRIR